MECVAITWHFQLKTQLTSDKNKPAAAVPKMKKSYHSIAVPMNAAM
jgi:hypothetical protein